MSASAASATAPRAIIERHLLRLVAENCISRRGARAAPCCAYAEPHVGIQLLRPAHAAVAIAVGLADRHQVRAARGRATTAVLVMNGQPIVAGRLLLGDRHVEDQSGAERALGAARTSEQRRREDAICTAP